MKNKLVSVIIPVYNVERYLDKCLSSVIGQTYHEMEVILINDGSSDGSDGICSKWEEADSRIHYVKKENEGSGPTRNLGIAMSSGDYITFLDSDDWWHESYLEEMMAYADQAQVVVCDMFYVDIDKRGELCPNVSEVRMEPGKIYRPGLDTDLINRCRVFLCGKVFHKSLFIENHILQPDMAINDFPIVPLLIAEADSVCRAGKPLYYYLRGREGNTVTNISALFSFRPALDALQMNFKSHGLDEAYRDALHKLYFSQVRFAIRKGILAMKGGKDKGELHKLKGQLFAFMDEHWPSWPRIDGRTFRTSPDAELKEAVKFVLFDDDLLLEGKGVCDYLVLLEDSLEEMDISLAGKVIRVSKSKDLSGQALLWDLADKILFQGASL